MTSVISRNDRIRIGRVILIKTPASPNWYLEWCHEGKQYRRTTKTRSKKEADRFAKKLNAELELHQFRPPEKRCRKATLGDAMQARLIWLANNNRTAKTRSQFERHCRQLAAILRMGINTRLDAVSVLTIDELVETMKNDGIKLPRAGGQRRTRGGTPLSDKTIRDALISIKSLMKFAVKRDMLPRNLLAGYELLEVLDKEREVFPPTVLAGLYADPEMGDIWRLLFFTCLRAREFTWMTREDVIYNSEGRPHVLAVRKKRCPQTGKTWVPKHGHERLVPLAPDAVDLVAQQLARPGEVPWLFEACDSRGDQKGKWTYGPLLRRFHGRLEAVGHHRAGLHAMRHTGATFLANQAKMPIAQLQKFLGHKDISKRP